jgi:hypothetical protein
MIRELILHSNKGFCFVENYNNDAIPMKHCNYDDAKNPVYLIGEDFLNSNKEVSIKLEDIKAYMHVESEDHKLYKRFALHFKTLRDVCIVEKLELDNPFLYKRIPINQKIISYILNKNYNEICLKELKDLWISYIEKFCISFESYIESELFESSNDLYKTELLKIKKDLKEIKKFKEIKAFKNKEELCKFWPALLMPSPSFVDL